MAKPLGLAYGAGGTAVVGGILTATSRLLSPFWSVRMLVAFLLTMFM